MMNRFVMVSTAIMVLVLSSMVLSIGPAEGAAGEDAEKMPTRQETDNLDVSGLVRLETDARYDTIRFSDNGSLEVIGVTISVNKVICDEDTENTSILLQNSESRGALLSVQDGYLNGYFAEVSVINSRLTVVNGTSLLPNGEDGGRSMVFLESEEEPLTIRNSEITIRGHAGGQGDSENWGGDGGFARLQLSTGDDGEVEMTGTEVLVQGGAGGNSQSPGTRAGQGGDANIRIETGSISIDNCNFRCTSGKAGSHSPQSQGASGGNTEIKISARNDIVVHQTNIESEDGIDTNTEEPEDTARVWFESDNGGLYWDHEKTSENKMSIISNVTCSVFTINTVDGAELHEVAVTGDNPQGSGTIELYWWAKISVHDKYGEPLENTAITYRMNNDPVPYPRDGTQILTDINGRANLEIVAFKDDDIVRYTFEAAMSVGGATGTSDVKRFENNQNERVDIEVVRILLDIVDPDISEPIGGIVVLSGTAQSGNPTQNLMQGVTIYVDEEEIGEAMDDSEESAPPFSVWSLEMDTRDFSDGQHKLSIVGRDTSYTVRVDRNIRINQKSINHIPVLHLVEISDSTDEIKALSNGEEGLVHVSQDEPEIEVLVETYDWDWQSDIIFRGKTVKQVQVSVIYLGEEEGVEEEEEVFSKTIITEDIQQKNSSGGYKASFSMNANRKGGESGVFFDEGQYRMEFTISDDADLLSINQYVEFELLFDFFPSIELFIKGDTGFIRPKVDAVLPGDSFILATDDSHTLGVTFNLTESNDIDDDLYGAGKSWYNLKFTVTILDESGETYKVIEGKRGVSEFSFEFDVEDVEEEEYGVFTMNIRAEDQQGLPEEETIYVKVQHNPPPEVTGLFGQFGVEWGIVFYLFEALIVLLIIAYVGVTFFLTKKYRKDQTKKVAILEKKRKEDEKATKSSAIEDELTGRMTSKKYLERTGADKGKDEFAKELHEAQKKEGLPESSKEKTLPPAGPGTAKEVNGKDKTMSKTAPKTHSSEKDQGSQGTTQGSPASKTGGPQGQAPPPKPPASQRPGQQKPAPSAAKPSVPQAPPAQPAGPAGSAPAVPPPAPQTQPRPKITGQEPATGPGGTKPPSPPAPPPPPSGSIRPQQQQRKPEQ